METTMLVWPASGFDDEVLQRWGLRLPAGVPTLPTRDDVRLVCRHLGWDLTETTVAYSFGRTTHETWIATAYGPDAPVTQVALTENVLRLPVATLPAAYRMLRKLALICGWQVVAFGEGRADAVVTEHLAYADLKAAHAHAAASLVG